MVFFVIELRTRAVQIAGVRINPDGVWMMQIARSLVDPRGWLPTKRDTPDSRPGPAIHESVGRTTQVDRSEIGTDPGE